MRPGLLAFALVAVGCNDGRATRRAVEVEVVAPQTSVGGVDLSIPIDDALVAKIAGHPDVAAATPRMPVRGDQAISPFGGIADGIPVSAVAGDRNLATRFVEGATPVPMIMSEASIETYNQVIAQPGGRPPLQKHELQLVIDEAKTFPITIAPGRQIDAVLVGFSPHAAALGVTFPIGDVARWNTERGEPTHYASVRVVLRDAGRRKAFEDWLADENLRLATP